MTPGFDDHTRVLTSDRAAHSFAAMRLRSPAAGAVLAVALACASLPDRPPQEHGKYRAADLVELVRVEPGIHTDVRYATARNFVGRPVYMQARVFLQRPAAEAVARAHRALAAQGYGLLVFDGYRPWSVTRLFWEVTPSSLREFVADPRKGSRHNRGCAVDLTLFDLATGAEVEMPSPYDDFTDKAAQDYEGGSPGQAARRAILREAMVHEGFLLYPSEWWHYDYEDWREYPILDVPFERLAGR
jgi:D-alanyl-D-alanine dipeptidase